MEMGRLRQQSNSLQIIVSAPNIRTTCIHSLIYLPSFLGSSFPQQVLSVSTNGSEINILGSMLELNQGLSISETGPLVVDTIGRTAYWYSQSDSLIYSQSLHSGSIQVSILPLHAQVSILPLPRLVISLCSG